MRTLVVGMARLLLWVFFRRVVVVHPERLPASGPVIYVLNHPNGLIDPLFILCQAGRPVSFLAKEPLFRMFFVGSCLRALDALPVYRAQDHVDPKQNAQTFASARDILARGGSIALFPEGTSHSDPTLKPLKTGAARIALGAAAPPTNVPLRIVPVGLAYDAKQTFRSRAQIQVGESFEVAHVALTESGEPPAEPVRQLTEQIGAALAGLLVQSDRTETLKAIDLARRLFAADDPALRTDHDAVLDLQKRISRLEAALRPVKPDLVKEITERVVQHGRTLEALGVAEHDIVPARLTPGRLFRRVVISVLWLPATALMTAGALLNIVPYRFTAVVSRKASHGEEDVVATAKLLAALLAFPVTWGAWALLALLWRGWPTAALTLVTVALLGYVSLVFREQLDRHRATLRAFGLVLFQPGTFAHLVNERRELRELMTRIAESLPG